VGRGRGRKRGRREREIVFRKASVHK